MWNGITVPRPIPVVDPEPGEIRLQALLIHRGRL